MSKSIDKRAKHDNQDRLSALPDCVLLHILSFLNSKHAVQTCILSTRWKNIWKHIPTLILHSSEFSGLKSFATFVSQILTLRDSSIAPHTLDLQCRGTIDTELLGMILNYICSHNAHIQQLRICVTADSRPILSCISKCRALTSLKLSIYPRDSDSGRALTSLKPSICPRDSDSDDNKETLFSKSLNLPLLTSLDLENFTFCGGESGCAEPFSAFTKLNSLVIRCCKVKDAQILNISSETLVNLTVEGYLSNLSQIKLSTPSLCIFTFTGIPVQKICGSGLSSVKQVNIDAQGFGSSVDYGLILLSWLQDLVSVESLSVSSTTVQILSLVPNLLKVKIPSLHNLKSLVVQWMPLNYGSLYPYMETAMLKKAASKSRKEAAMLSKTFKACFKKPLPMPRGIIDFLRQNSPSAKVNITSDLFKQIEESLKGVKNTSYCSQFAAPTSAAESASAIAAAPASAANDDKSSNEDKVEKHQLTLNHHFQIMTNEQ